MPSLDSITFDTAGLVLQGDEGNTRVWQTADGDPVTLYYFNNPSPLRAAPGDLDRWRAQSRASVGPRGGAMIEVGLVTLDGVGALREIVKVPQNPTGMGYLGSLMMPFRDFGCMIAVACRERGTTGMRDTMIFATLMQKGEISLPSGAGQPAGWMADPYDPAIATPPGRNRADDPQYDAIFPDHPLSRLRRMLGQIAGTVRIADEVKREAADG